MNDDVVERVRNLLRFAGGELLATSAGSPTSGMLVVEAWEVAGRRLIVADGRTPGVLRDDLAGWVTGGLVEEVAAWLDGEVAPRSRPRSFAEAAPEDLGW